MEYLATLFAFSPSLRHLYISHNAIGDKGVGILAEASFFQLQSCCVADNEIGPLGAHAIADQLRCADCVLEKLDLTGNMVRDEGVVHLVKGLSENTSLKSLDLRYNYISIRGLCVIRDMLMIGDNVTLETLHLEENDDNDCRSTPPSQLGGRKHQETSIPLECSCNRCKVKSEINFYLRLNRSGRHSFADLRLTPAVWPRILAKSSKRDPSLLFIALSVRPDIAMHQLQQSTPYLSDGDERDHNVTKS